MANYKEISERIDLALARAPTQILGSCEPKEGEPYKCFNCKKFDLERDGCFTEWMEKYGFEKQPDRCPGYEPPKDGEFVLTISGAIDI